MGSRLEKNSNFVRKRIENHTFHDEEGEEYQGSTFGGFSDYMRRKKIKLQNLDAELRSQSNDKPQIFRGLVISVNGYTQPPLNDLHLLIVTHGGGFIQYLDGKTECTHIVASQLTPKKKAEFAKYRIVKPAWIVESVKAGRLLPWDNYRLVDEGVTQKILAFDSGQMVSQVTRQHEQQSYRGQEDTSWFTPRIRSILKDFEQAPNRAVSQKTIKIQQSVPPTHDLLGATETPAADEVRKHANSQVDEEASGRPVSRHSSQGLSHDSSLLQDTTSNQASDHALVVEEHDARDSTSVSDVMMNRKLTAEEHNAILLQNPHMAKSSTANPDFLNQYYRESRLHHLSAWKAQLKAQLQARAIEKSSSQKEFSGRKAGGRRYIMHVDFDSFFAAVSLRKSPHLMDQPVVVAHGSGPGSEIASCNYPAREFGVKNGMWMKYALELCPHLKVLPYDFKAYEEASRLFYDAILDIDGVVQSISIDEALIDVSTQCIKAGGSDGNNVSEGSVHREQLKANDLAQALRASVKLKTDCHVSVGVGGNILLAKVALRKAKPAGQHQILPEDVLDFIGDLKVTDLPGVAHSLGRKLEEIGVKLVKDIRELTKARLTAVLGPKTGEKLWDYARGIDKIEVGDQVVRKSVSAEVNWGIRFVTQQQAEDFVQTLCDELQKRLLENAVKGKQLTMKIMRKSADAGLDPPKNLGHGKCDTFNKSTLLGVATNDKDVLGKEAISILRSYGFSPGELRGLGVQMQKLEPIKSLASTKTTLLEGSQRRLTFRKTEKRSDNEGFSRSIPGPQPKFDVVEDVDGNSEPVPQAIEDVETPPKPRAKDAIVGAIHQVSKHDDKPLNMLGTQFVLPSQVDTATLAELPEDIRKKLAAPAPATVIKQRRLQTIAPDSGASSPSHSPYLSDSEYGLPRQSQLDPDILSALPADLREELLGHYDATNRPQKSAMLLPDSLWENKRTTKKLVVTPTKKQRAKIMDTSASGWTQANFVSGQERDSKTKADAPFYREEIPDDLLNELPKDIRLEILAEQRKTRMESRSGLTVRNSQPRPKGVKINTNLPRGQQTLQLPVQSEIPTFTSKKLCTLPELRDAMSAWVQEFSEDGEQGPFEEDISALSVYLSRVVVEEKNMAKATAVINWLVYLINDWPFSSEGVQLSWRAATKMLKDAIQKATASRGLPPIAFDEM